MAKKKRTGDTIPVQTRKYVYERDDNSCVYCGLRFFEHAEPWLQIALARATLDHVVPHSEGGENIASNLVTSCHACNNAKGDQTLEEFCPDKADDIRAMLAKEGRFECGPADSPSSFALVLQAALSA